jgi:nicotinate-nucleotide adenylyltransferase
MRTIGLLGGSFNPAHDGHIYLSQVAKKQLGLDAVWWLVSPANPFKEAASLAPYAERFAYARALPKPCFIEVRDDEARHELYYTYTSLRHLQRRYPHVRFVWLMGADNLMQFHRWQHASEIMQRIRVAVIDRSPAHLRQFRSVSALRYASRRVPPRHLKQAILPAWSYIFTRPHPVSATILRKTLGKRAFLLHNSK